MFLDKTVLLQKCYRHFPQYYNIFFYNEFFLIIRIQLLLELFTHHTFTESELFSFYYINYLIFQGNTEETFLEVLEMHISLI